MVHHKLTQYCISIIIKQKEKSLNPHSLSLPCMVFLGSSGWGKKRFRIVLNGTERGTLVVWGLFQEKPLNSPEATAGNRILNPTRVGSHTGTPSPAGEHRYPCSQQCQPWCWTTDPVVDLLSAAPDSWTTHRHPCPVCHMCLKHSVQFQSLCGTMS